MRKLFWSGIGALLAVSAVVAACGDDDGDSSDVLQPSCDGIEELDSYRYALRLQLDAPAFDDPQPEASPGPIDPFAEALSAFFSDLQLEGAYVAPDRTLVTLEFENEELEWRQIGDRGWVRFGDEWEEQAASSNGGLTPEVVCQDIIADLAGSLQGVEREEDSINGVDAYHYSLDRSDIEELPDLLQSESLPDLPEDVQFDIWLARDGLWPVKVALSASDEDENGEPIELNMEMELLDVNDDGIEIEPPEGFRE